MSSYGSVWVKVIDLERDLAFLRDNYNNKAELPEGAVFACANANESEGEFPDELLEELSEYFEEVIFMEVQTTVDLFLYSHWKNCERIRELSYSGDAGWYLVNGIKETWEDFLFQEQEKLRQLSYLDLEYLAKNTSEYQQAQQTAAQIEEVWATAELCENCFYPMATASELYQLVKQYFKLA